MIKPIKNKLYQKLLNWFLDKKFKQRFSEVRFHFEDTINKDKSILVVGNHSTWWDGFLVWQLNRQMIHKEFYCMMLETQLKKQWFLQKVGCFSINPGSRTVVESLKFGASLLENKANMLLFYPQGRFYSLFDEDFQFNKGIEKVLKKAEHTDLLIYCLFTDYSSFEKPYLNVFLKIVENPSQLDTQQIELLYKTFYTACKQKHISQFKP